MGTNSEVVSQQTSKQLQVYWVFVVGLISNMMQNRKGMLSMISFWSIGYIEFVILILGEMDWNIGA